MEGKTWASTRYSKTRRAGAQHTVATKLTDTEYNCLHHLAVENRMSDYEYLRRIIQKQVVEFMLKGKMQIVTDKCP